MERVLGILGTQTSRIYPLSILAQRPLWQDRLDDQDIVIFVGNKMLSPLDAERIQDSRSIPSAMAFQRRLGHQVLDFHWTNQQIQDRQTNSVWSIFGHAKAGPLKGEQLASVDTGVHFAFAWLAFRPQSSVFKP